MPDHRNPTQRMSDNVANLFGDAVADIRHKLVEEAWFGRELGCGRGVSEGQSVQTAYGSSVGPTIDRVETGSLGIDLSR